MFPWSLQTLSMFPLFLKKPLGDPSYSLNHDKNDESFKTKKNFHKVGDVLTKAAIVLKLRGAGFGIEFATVALVD